MLENNYFARLKALLFAKGISCRQSGHLIEELQDHLTLKIAEFEAQGNNPSDAERLAMESVGTPEDIAEKAAADLQSGWPIRYALLLCGGGFFLASLLTMLVIVFLGYHLSGGPEYDNGDIPQPNLSILLAEVILFNWLPLLMGMVALALLIRFSSIGWKSIFIAAISLGIAVSFAEARMEISSIADSTKLCFMTLDTNFIIQRFFGLVGGEHEFFPAILIFKLFAPLGMCLFARYGKNRSPVPGL